MVEGTGACMRRVAQDSECVYERASVSWLPAGDGGMRSLPGSRVSVVVTRKRRLSSLWKGVWWDQSAIEAPQGAIRLATSRGAW